MPATIFHHPRAEVKVSDPREQDVLPVRDDLCSVCGHPRASHWAITGRFISCDGAQQYAAVQTTDPQRYNDPYPAVTCAVRDVLLRKCGPAIQAVLHTLTHDEVLAIAHTAGKAAIATYLAEIAK